jgi:hypothetical protein
VRILLQLSQSGVLPQVLADKLVVLLQRTVTCTASAKGFMHVHPLRVLLQILCVKPLAGELDVLLQRAARGRDELELRRLDEAEKRGNRFRCMVQVSDGTLLSSVGLDHKCLQGCCHQETSL